MWTQAIFALILASGVAALFWMLVRQGALKIQEQYQLLADRFELELTLPPAQLAGFNRPEPFVHGHYRGREMSVSVPGKGLQNTRQIETVLKISVDERKLSCQMTATGWLSRFRQRDSGKKVRWQSGDPDFDAAVDVRTNSDKRLTELLDADARGRVFRLLKDSKATLYIGNGVVALAELGLIADEKKRSHFEKAAEVLCDLAELIETRQ